MAKHEASYLKKIGFTLNVTRRKTNSKDKQNDDQCLKETPKKGGQTKYEKVNVERPKTSWKDNWMDNNFLYRNPKDDKTNKI